MSSGDAQSANDEMNAVAEWYVHLVLALGQHDRERLWRKLSIQQRDAGKSFLPLFQFLNSP
jgi:hypothetical protein